MVSVLTQTHPHTDSFRLHALGPACCLCLMGNVNRQFIAGSKVGLSRLRKTVICRGTLRSAGVLHHISLYKVERSRVDI